MKDFEPRPQGVIFFEKKAGQFAKTAAFILGITPALALACSYQQPPEIVRSASASQLLATDRFAHIDIYGLKENWIRHWNEEYTIDTPYDFIKIEDTYFSRSSEDYKGVGVSIFINVKEEDGNEESNTNKRLSNRIRELSKFFKPIYLEEDFMEGQERYTIKYSRNRYQHQHIILSTRYGQLVEFLTTVEESTVSENQPILDEIIRSFRLRNSSVGLAK